MPAQPVLPRPLAEDYPGLARPEPPRQEPQVADQEREQHQAAARAASRRPLARLAAGQEQADQALADQVLALTAAADQAAAVMNRWALGLHPVLAEADRQLRQAADQWAAALSQAGADLAQGLLAELALRLGQGPGDSMRWYPRGPADPGPGPHP